MHNVKTWFVRAVEEFDGDSEAWGVTRRRALLLALLPIIVIGAVALIAALSLVSKSSFRPLFNFVAAEDSLLEWLQFLFVFLASLVFGWLGVQFIRRGQRAIGVLYLLIALGAFFVAGEEISWGQRIFGLHEPDALVVINHQKELNIHNIRPVQRAFGFVVLFGGMYGVLAPLISVLVRARRERSPLSFLLVPPLFLLPAFLIPFGYRLFRLVVWPGTNALVVRFGEALELCLYFGLLMFAVLNLRRLHQEQPALVVRVLPAG